MTPDEQQVAWIEAYLNKSVPRGEIAEVLPRVCRAHLVLAQSMRLLAAIVRVQQEPVGNGLEAHKRRALIEALDATEWVQRKAAKRLGVSDRVMSYQMRRHGLHELRAARAEQRRHENKDR